MSKILGIDIGEVRVGIALGSEETKLASPLLTLDNDSNLIANLKKISEENQVDLIIAGLPRSLDGQDTMQTEYSRRIGNHIKDNLKIDLIFQDEALTSVKAKEELESRKKPYNKGDIDKLAACYILEDYLMGKN